MRSAQKSSAPIANGISIEISRGMEAARSEHAARSQIRCSLASANTARGGLTTDVRCQGTKKTADILVAHKDVYKNSVSRPTPDSRVATGS